MKKKIFLCLLLVISMSIISGCNNNINNNLTNNIDKNNNINDDSNNSITLMPDNNYFIISDIDFSRCIYDNGYFSGNLYFNSHTTEKYVETYNEYFYRELYFDIIDNSGNVVGTEVANNNYVYDRDYVSQEYTYLFVNSKNPIKEVRLKKIVIYKD